MSLDMTMGTREAALDATAEQIEADAAPVVRLGLHNLLVVTGIAFCVLVYAALGVLLFLR